MKKLTPLFVIFDGPPAHESGRFVEVETADGESASLGGEWAEREDGLWSLGPVYSQGDIDQLTKRCEDTETDCEDYSAAHDEALTERDEALSVLDALLNTSKCYCESGTTKRDEPCAWCSGTDLLSPDEEEAR